MLELCDWMEYQKCTLLPSPKSSCSNVCPGIILHVCLLVVEGFILLMVQYWLFLYIVAYFAQCKNESTGHKHCYLIRVDVAVRIGHSCQAIAEIV